MDKEIVLYDVDYPKYLGAKCKCGYYYDEGDYQQKGREDDFVNYNCEWCGRHFKVMTDERTVNKNAENMYKDAEYIIEVLTTKDNR